MRLARGKAHVQREGPWTARWGGLAKDDRLIDAQKVPRAGGRKDAGLIYILRRLWGERERERERERVQEIERERERPFYG